MPELCLTNMCLAGQATRLESDNFILSHGEFHFPDIHGARVYGCNFAVDNYHDGLFQNLNIHLPEHLLNAVNKRKAEFLAGRFCAANAMQLLGIDNRTVEVGENRCPRWPETMTGAITHTDTSAKCIVAQSAWSDVGIDEEVWLSSDVAEQICHQILNAREIEILRNTDLSFEKAVTMVFSAKETLFKAFYRLIGEYFGFEAFVLVTEELDKKSGVLRFYPDSTMAQRLNLTTPVAVNYITQSDGILTYYLPDVSQDK